MAAPKRSALPAARRLALLFVVAALASGCAGVLRFEVFVPRVPLEGPPARAVVPASARGGLGFEVGPRKTALALEVDGAELTVRSNVISGQVLCLGPLLPIFPIFCLPGFGGSRPAELRVQLLRAAGGSTVRVDGAACTLGAPGRPAFPPRAVVYGDPERTDEPPFVHEVRELVTEEPIEVAGGESVWLVYPLSPDAADVVIWRGLLWTESEAPPLELELHFTHEARTIGGLGLPW